MVVQRLSYEHRHETDMIFWVKDKGPVLSLIQSSFTFFVLFLFSFCIVHNKYLETDVPTNQKVFIKYPIV